MGMGMGMGLWGKVAKAGSRGAPDRCQGNALVPEKSSKHCQGSALNREKLQAIAKGARKHGAHIYQVINDI